MSVKEHAALTRLLSLLESRFAMRVLWALRDGRAQTFRVLQDSVGGVTPNTLNTRLKDLRAADLIAHAKNGYLLTSAGLDLVRRLADIPSFALKWATQQARKTA